MIRKITIFALLFLVCSQSVFALYGTRPRGMGGAFTAVANDASAVYWNPAGLALNPEVSATGSSLLNNRNLRMGDNVLNLKFCYQTAMSPFQWIAGVGIASVFALRGAEYLSEQGVLKKGWGRPGEKTAREESMAPQVKGSEEVVSLKQVAKEDLETAAKGLVGGASEIAQESLLPHRQSYLIPWSPPGYYSYHHPHYYWEPPEPVAATQAQFALGLSWVNDTNPLRDEKRNWYTLSVASGFEQRIALGANMNVYYLKKISTDIAGLGADLDLGLIAKPVEYISLGLVTTGILTTDIKWQDSSTTRYEMLVNGGLAVNPVPFLTLAADVHNIFGQNSKAATYHYGAEVALIPGLVLRGGLDDGNKTAGASVALGNLIIDYAYLGGRYNRTQMLGGTWKF